MKSLLIQAFEEPNHTQTPNKFFDMIADMGDAELRVTLVMIRHTFGFHKSTFKMGMRKIGEASGLTRQGAIAGAEAAERRGIFKRTNPDSQKEAEWELNLLPPVNTDDMSSRITPNVKQDYSQCKEGLQQFPIKENIKEIKRNGADRADLPTDYPIDWQLAAGQSLINVPDQIRQTIINTANTIDIGCAGAGALASAFMTARGIIIPDAKIKAQRKACREMLGMGVKSDHVTRAVNNLLAAGMTVTDLFSVVKTAVDLANPAPNAAAQPVRNEFPKLVNGRLQNE